LNIRNDFLQIYQRFTFAEIFTATFDEYLICLKTFINILHKL